METQKVACKNCDAVFEGKYCNNCGQKAATKRFSVKGVLHDLPHTMFHVDKGILKNLASIFYPRAAVSEYIYGRRIKYFNPLLFFLLSTGLVIFIEHISHFQAHFVFVLKWKNNIYDVGGVILKYLKYIYLFSAFVFALPSYLIFKKTTGYNYSEQVIANIFIMGYVNIAYFVLSLFLIRNEAALASEFLNCFPMNLSVLILYFVFSGFVYYNSAKPFTSWTQVIFSVLCQALLFNIFIGIIGYLIVFSKMLGLS